MWNMLVCQGCGLLVGWTIEPPNAFLCIPCYDDPEKRAQIVTPPEPGKMADAPRDGSRFLLLLPGMSPSQAAVAQFQGVALCVLNDRGRWAVVNPAAALGWFPMDARAP